MNKMKEGTNTTKIQRKYKKENKPFRKKKCISESYRHQKC